MENVTITEQLDGKEIIYYVKSQKWTYDGVEEAIVRKLSPELAGRITKVLKAKVTEYQERIKREEEERKDKEYKEIMATHNAFKADVAKYLPDGFTVSYCTIDRNEASYAWHGKERDCRIKKNDIDAEVEFNNRVSSSRSYYSHGTDMPWVRRFEFKSQRFSTLEKAIKNACDKINEKINRQAEQEEYKNELNNKRIKCATELKKLGISLKIDSKWISDGRHGGHESKKEMAEILIKDTDPKSSYSNKVAVRGYIESLYDKNIEISQVKIIGTFTPAQFNMIAELVKSMDVKADSSY